MRRDFGQREAGTKRGAEKGSAAVRDEALIISLVMLLSQGGENRALIMALLYILT